MLQGLSKESISKRFEQLESQINTLCGTVNDLKIAVAQLQEKDNGLEQRFTSMEGRVNGQASWFLGILTALVAGLLSVLIKIVIFPNS
jgi:hypothetical protein